jgi:hypothetical protein
MKTTKLKLALGLVGACGACCAIPAILPAILAASAAGAAWFRPEFAVVAAAVLAGSAAWLIIRRRQTKACDL